MPRNSVSHFCWLEGWSQATTYQIGNGPDAVIDQGEGRVAVVVFVATFVIARRAPFDQRVDNFSYDAQLNARRAKFAAIAGNISQRPDALIYQSNVVAAAQRLQQLYKR